MTNHIVRPHADFERWARGIENFPDAVRAVEGAYGQGWADCEKSHPAATAREEAWKAMVEALTYIASHRGLTLLGDGSYSDGVRDGWIELADAADRALALARSTGRGSDA